MDWTATSAMGLIRLRHQIDQEFVSRGIDETTLLMLIRMDVFPAEWGFATFGDGLILQWWEGGGTVFLQPSYSDDEKRLKAVKKWLRAMGTNADMVEPHNWRVQASAFKQAHFHWRDEDLGEDATVENYQEEYENAVSLEEATDGFLETAEQLQALADEAEERAFQAQEAALDLDG